MKLYVNFVERRAFVRGGEAPQPGDREIERHVPALRLVRRVADGVREAVGGADVRYLILSDE